VVTLSVSIPNCDLSRMQGMSIIHCDFLTTCHVQGSIEVVKMSTRSRSAETAERA